MGLNKKDWTYEAKKECYQNKREEDLDSIDSLVAKLKNTGKKIKFHDIDAKIEEAVNSNKTKTILELNFQESASIKSFAVK